ncbi:prolyl oligopeptidase family serine peptidase [Altererythrobacter sp. MF3-039]|uniref:prolyl oligopeptidase family serine peptidase n=1 Tax=Altererythrobacter sp. MF3-039 TaxID=3252901 RepID=UPI00390CD825
MRRTPIALVGALLALSAPAIGNDVAVEGYPQTRTEPIVETIFGEKVADPFRWLEQDVRRSPEVAAWVQRQNAHSARVLAEIPQIDWFKRKIASLIDYERFGAPIRAGNRYFFSRNSGTLDHAQLFVQEGLDGERELLIDPNIWSQDGTAALGDIRPTRSGGLLAFSIQDNGSDWRTIRFMDVNSGEVLPDRLQWVKYPASLANFDWVGENGLLYLRYPEPEEGEEFFAPNAGQALYYHRLGTDQSEDVRVFSTPGAAIGRHDFHVSHDGRWLVIASRQGTEARHEIRVIDLASRNGLKDLPEQLVRGFDHEWDFIDALGPTLYFRTNEGARNFRLVSIDMEAEQPGWQVVIPERELSLEQAAIVGDRFIISYLQNGATTAAMVTLDGEPMSGIRLGQIGTAAGFTGSPGDSETFYRFSSFNRPASIFRLDLDTGDTTVFAEPDAKIDPDAFLIEQKLFRSKDGTAVPMFVVRRKDTLLPAPTLLYGYGGFDISQTPAFSSVRMAWLEAGGVFALANIRGGGEFGKQWHDGGRRENKQNSFDDFIAAGETLIAAGYTPPDGLAIQGGSNGGLLVGAVTNQRPDLFAAANPNVGVMDMLRFDRWTAGRLWVDDYGYPEREKDFRVLRSYSPYHNIRDGKDYPAIIVTAADTDDRVVPAHSFKYAAALQAADLGDAPRIIRIETGAGHGAGKPTSKLIEENGEILGFLAHHAGLKVAEKPQ